MSKYADLLKELKEGFVSKRQTEEWQRQAREVCNELGQDLSGIDLTDETEPKLLRLLEAKFQESELTGTVRAGTPPKRGTVSLAQVILGNYTEAAYNLYVVAVGREIFVYYDKVPKGGNLRS